MSNKKVKLHLNRTNFRNLFSWNVEKQNVFSDTGENQLFGRHSYLLEISQIGKVELCMYQVKL